ncbi:truncated hypothetical protein [Streptococcus dysgalactiae subsp. equisimilis RE378]|nr:truncated hypothetical protein [Streptococcus dysgalactiae subsp. equisimilis RE378]
MLMVFATGYNFQKPLHEILTYHVWGLLLGVVVSVIVGVKISRLLNLPFSLWPYVPKRLTLKQRYQFMLTKDPTVLVKASHFSSILFVTSYIAYLLIDKGGYWVLISSAAVLSGEHLEHIKKRTIGRVLGTIVGIVIGLGIIQLHVSVTYLILLLVLFNFLTEYYMPRQYTIANFFTNPQVIILMALSNSFRHSVLTIRFLGVFIGSLLTLFIILILEYALQSMIDHKATIKEWVDD